MCKVCWTDAMSVRNINATQFAFDYLVKYSTRDSIDVNLLEDWVKEQVKTEEFPPNINYKNLLEGVRWWINGKDDIIIRAYLSQSGVINWPFKDAMKLQDLKVIKVS